MTKSLLSAKRSLLVLVAAVVLLSMLGGVVLASNMGFKLNYGIVNAVNKLLTGSGVSIHAIPAADDSGQPTLELNINPGETQNSNMGFKLNVIAVPDEGILVEVPGGNQYVVKIVDGSLIVE